MRELPGPRFGGRVLANAVFSIPPVALVAVGMVLAFQGGAITPERWQPVAVGIAVVLGVLALVGAVPAVPRRAWLTLGALAFLVLFSLGSLAWSESRDATAETVARLASLGAAALVGAAYAARPGAAIALVSALAAAGLVLSIAVEVRLLGGATSIFSGPRLSWPINYANGAAALLWLPVGAQLALASAPRLRPLVRGLLGGAAALGLLTGLVAQSRGGTAAIVGTLVLMAIVAPNRPRFALILLAVVAPVGVAAAGVVPGAIDGPDTVTRIGVITGVAAAVAAIVVWALSAAERRAWMPFGGREGRVALVAWGLVLIVVAGGLLVRVGNPISAVEARWDEFSNVTAVAPADATAASRFGTAASNRYDYWRVGLDESLRHPVAGIGAGAFAVPWYEHRRITENVISAHSWEIDTLVGTGLIGLVAIAVFLLAPLVGGIRYGRRSPDPGPVAALGLIGVVAYFVLHGSTEWLTDIPAIAIPAAVAIGALAALGPPVGGARMAFARLRLRVIITVAAVALVALAVPPYLATRHQVHAEQVAFASVPAATSDLDAAERWNPFSAQPALLRSTILDLAGDQPGALAAAERAVELAPNRWDAWLNLAEIREANGALAPAREAARRALELNPRSAAVLATIERLGA